MSASKDDLDEAVLLGIFSGEIEPLYLPPDVSPSISPLAIVIGAQPGAGKSTVMGDIRRRVESLGWTVEIDTDELRTHHPQHKRFLDEDDQTAGTRTNRDANRWAEMLRNKSKDKCVNVLLESSMRTPESLSVLLKDFRSAKYGTEVHVLAVKPRLSELSILLRYEKQRAATGHGRLVPSEFHLSALNGMLETVRRIEEEKLTDRLFVHLRDVVAPVYSNEIKDGEWIGELGACAAIKAEWERPMGLDECRKIFQACDGLMKTLMQPGRGSGLEYALRVKDLWNQAHADLDEATQASIV